MASDPVEDLQRMVDRIQESTGDEPLDYTLLSDADAAVIRRYGLFNQDDPRGRAIPHPTTYVIDREGVVRWKFTEVDYRLRPTNEDILAELQRLE